jgi:cation transport ATPase
MSSRFEVGGSQVIEHRSTRLGRWLRERRLRIALWIAVAEGILVALSKDFTRWTVIIVAVPLILFYVAAGRQFRWDSARQISWIAGASQALAVVAVILAFIISWLALVLVVIFALVALFFLFTDRS